MIFLGVYNMSLLSKIKTRVSVNKVEKGKQYHPGQLVAYNYANIPGFKENPRPYNEVNSSNPELLNTLHELYINQQQGTKRKPKKKTTKKKTAKPKKKTTKTKKK